MGHFVVCFWADAPELPDLYGVITRGADRKTGASILDTGEFVSKWKGNKQTFGGCLSCFLVTQPTQQVST